MKTYDTNTTHNLDRECTLCGKETTKTLYGFPCCAEHTQGVTIIEKEAGRAFVERNEVERRNKTERRRV